MWAEPLFDYFAEFALCTRALQVKNLPVTFQFEDLHRAFAKFGTVLKIRRYASHALIYYSKPSEARLAFESLSALELPSGVVCKLSLARIKLKDTPSAEAAASPELSPALDKLSTLNLLELGSSETGGLTHFLLHNSLPEQEMLMSKARSIVKRAAFAHSAAHQPPPAAKEYIPPEPRYDAVPVVDTTSLQGKRLAGEPLEREEAYPYKKPKPDSDVNPFVAQPPPRMVPSSHYYAGGRDTSGPPPMTTSHYMRPQPTQGPPAYAPPAYQYSSRYQPQPPPQQYNHAPSEASGMERCIRRCRICTSNNGASRRTRRVQTDSNGDTREVAAARTDKIHSTMYSAK